MGKAETKQQLADWWDSFDTRYMRPYFSRPESESPTLAQQGMLPFSLPPPPGLSSTCSCLQNSISRCPTAQKLPKTALYEQHSLYVCVLP